MAQRLSNGIPDREAAAYAEEEALKRAIANGARDAPPLEDASNVTIPGSDNTNSNILKNLRETPSNAQLKQELWRISRDRKRQLDRIEDKLDTLLDRTAPTGVDEEEWEEAYVERLDAE